MDSIDKKILNILQENALMTAKELAEKLSITSSPDLWKNKKITGLWNHQTICSLIGCRSVGQEYYCVHEHHD